jgi:hypothetical protein
MMAWFTKRREIVSHIVTELAVNYRYCTNSDPPSRQTPTQYPGVGKPRMNNDDIYSLDGRCTCGAVKYRITAAPIFVYCCHCTWCQRETGSAFGLNAMIEANRVALLEGEPELVNVPSPSGKGQKLFRCPTCRVTVWSNYARAGGAVRFVRVGTLDEPSRVPPKLHIYTIAKQPWVILPTDVPAVEYYYERSDYWPAESLARIEALAKTG